MKLRDYQHDCIQKIKKRFESHNRLLIQLPTGAGKTFIFLTYLKENSNRSLIIVPTKDLLYQVKESALGFFHKSEVFAKENKIESDAKIYIATASSVKFPKFKEWCSKQKFDHIVIDEAHHAQSKTYLEFIDFYTEVNKNVKISGFTATPERLDKKSLIDIFEELVFEKNILDLINEDYLCDLNAYRIETKMKVNTRSMGDITLKNLRALDNPTRNGIILKTYKNNCLNSKTLIFCVSVDHAESIAKMMRNEGIKAAAIHGKTPKKERKKILTDFKSGNISVLSNCQLLTEGFDEPSIKELIIARPTKSKALYCQMIGRGLRKHKDKKIVKVYELTENNHDICSFEVVAGGEVQDRVSFNNGMSLVKIKKELMNINVEEVEIESNRYDMFFSLNKFLRELPANDRQKKELLDGNIFFIEPISYLEAGFLLWKHQLRKRYGFI